MEVFNTAVLVLYLLKEHVLVSVLTLFQVLEVHLSKDLEERASCREQSGIECSRQKE